MADIDSWVEAQEIQITLDADIVSLDIRHLILESKGL